LPTKIITEHLKEWLERVQTYPIFGNHESFPADQFDMWGEGSKWLKNEVADMWTGILGESEVA